MHQGQEHRHLDQRSDHRGEGLTGIDAEDGDGHGNGQLKVIGGGGKGECGRLFIGSPGLHGQKEGDQKHDQEVDGERDGDAHDVQRQLDDVFAFE